MLVRNPQHLCSYFNPRTHEECDSSRVILRPGYSNFNPRTHEECDYKGDAVIPL